MRTESTDLLAAAAFGGGVSVVGGFVIGGQSIPFFNVSITTLGMAAAGSLLAFAYGTPILDRRKLYGYAVGGIFIGIWTVHLLRWRGVEVPEEVAGPLAGAVALVSRWLVPLVLENMPAIWTRIFGTAGDKK